MDDFRVWCVSPFGTRIDQWLACPGAYDPDGKLIEKPWELVRAENIIEMAKMFGCPPSVILQEPAETLQLLQIYQMGNPPEEREE